MSKFNYILNDIAFDTLVIKCLYAEPTDEDIKECENQIKLLQKKEEQLQNNWNELNKYIDSRFKAIKFDYDEKIIDKFEFVVRENELLKLKTVLKQMQELENRKV